MQIKQGPFFKHYILVILFLCLITMSVQASTPLWTFIPETPTEVTLSRDENTQIIYTVHNQSYKPKLLLMKSIPGISQETTCQLSAKGICRLILNVNGSALQGQVLGGPILCEQGNMHQCYQPDPTNTLRIHLREQPFQQYTVTPLAGMNGTISPDTAQIVNSGSSLTLTATPNANFGVNQWLLDGNAVQNGGTTYQLTNIQSNHTVEVTFNIQQFTVTPSAGVNGTISPDTALIVNSGSNLMFTATPSIGFGVEEWLLDGNPVQSGGNSYQLNNIQSNHTLMVTFNQTTLSPLTQNLALSINSPSSDPILTGNPRLIRIENTGSVPAINVQVNTPTFPNGTSITNNECVGTLNAGATCDITITPGSVASSNNAANACTVSPGTEPVSSLVTISADNALPTSINVLVLGYGCIYQGGFLFSVNDATPNTGSIQGKVAALTDEANPLGWSTQFDNTAANSLTDGLANSNALTTPPGQYPAAQACLAKNDQGFTDWYLPAVCELSRYVGSGFDPACGTTNPNLYSTLYTNNLGELAGTQYWSSSQFSSAPQFNAWTQQFLDGSLSGESKVTALTLRCVRLLTP